MLGQAIGAGLSAIGSIVGNNAQNKAAKDAANKAWDRQQSVMKNQVQWRVQDAVKAGLHPLAALGMNPSSGPAAAAIGGDLGSNLAQAGQDIGRAMEANASPMDKANAQLTRLQLERGGLENELLRTQIASQRMRIAQQGTPGIIQNGGAPETISNPFTQEKTVVRNPDLGQTAENHYSDVGGFVYGGGAMIADFLRNNGYDPELAYRDPVGYAATLARDYARRWWEGRQSKGGGSGW